MSKLKELIAELCPNGVEYVKFDKICAYIRGITYNKSKEAKANDFNPWKVLRANNITLSSNTLNFDDIKLIKSDVKVKQEQFLKKNDILICAGSGSKEHIGKVAFITSDMEYTFGGFMAVIRCDSQLNSRYMYHILTGDIFKKYLKYALNSTTINNLNMSVMANFQFPVPPLPVQEEIVRILDSFTSLTAELQTKLQAELQARQKQYEYYRDTLLQHDKKYPMVKLGDIAIDIYRGSGITREQITEKGIPCVRYGEIYTTYNTWFSECISHTSLENISNPKYFEHGDILFAITGESVEDIAKSVAYVGNDKCLAGGDIVVLKHEQEPRYLAHVLATYEARKQKSKGKIKSKVVHSSVPAIKEIEIPLPPLDIQKRYADVLDNFEIICNDLNIGLPKEIELRKKQYEFYRDCLLTYAATGATISKRREEKRREEKDIIRLIQYVFGYVIMPLSKVATCFRGAYITKKSTKPGNVPVILGGQEPAYFIHESNHDGEIVVIARSGASAGFVSYWNEAVFITDGFGYEADEELMLPKYLFYTLKNKEKQLNAMKRGAGVPHVSGENLASILLSVPTLEQQKKIVSILDRFETLCNDMTAGLPAEIEARQKQYEYYRDRLLSFPKLT